MSICRIRIEIAQKKKLGYNITWVTGNAEATTGTFTQDEVIMPEVNQKGMLPALVAVQIVHPTMAHLVDKYSKWSITMKQQDAVVQCDDDECVDADKVDSGHTDAGSLPNLNATNQRINYAAPVLISSDKLYIQFQQDTGSTHTYRYRLGFVPRESSAPQKKSITENVQF